MKRERRHNFKYTEVQNVRKFFDWLHNKIHKLQKLRELTIVTVTPQGPEEFRVNKWITYLKSHLEKCLYLPLSTIN